MTEQQLIYTLALHHVSKIGDITAKKLIQVCGSSEAVLKEKKKNLIKIDGIGEGTIEGLFDKIHVSEAENELRFMKDHGVSCLYFMDSDYPERLKHCIDAPIILFQKGNINLNNQKIISIVGARKITPYGLDFCKSFVEDMAPFNPIIVSGFAYGVDITAQKAAIDLNLQTIGCLAHGFNEIYPKSHQIYVKSVERNGGFFSDFWSTSNFDRKNFLRRNRIIAGLSEATIVIESAEKGGSLVTADIANSYDRDVFAVPGRVGDIQSVGCNNLIKHQKAHMISTSMDVPFMLGWNLDKLPVQKKLFVELNEEEKIVHDYLSRHGKQLLDIISLDTKIPTYKLASILLNMELIGVVRPLPGKLFEVI